MRILVTGSSGVIGRELQRLVLDHAVLLIDKKDRNTLNLQGELAFNDLNFHLTSEKIRRFEPELIFHLAASFERTDESSFFYEVNKADNISASMNLNRLIIELESVKKVVFASSYLVYDPSIYLSDRPKPSLMLDENTPLHPRNLCGHAKLYEEGELEFIKRNMKVGLSVCHARIFRVYGLGSQDFISRCVDWGQKGIPVVIWNKMNTFDYIHARDVAKALYKLGFSKVDGVYNVGRGESRSIGEVCNLTGIIERPIQNDLPFENSCANISKIRELGWEPEISLEDGIEELKHYEK